MVVAAAGACCLLVLALQGNGVLEQIFSKGLSSFPNTHMPVPHLLPIYRHVVRRAVVFSSVAHRRACLGDPGPGSCHEEQLMHSVGATGSFGVSCGCCIVGSPCSELLKGVKGEGYQCPYFYVVSKAFHPSLPLGLFTGKDGRAHSKVLWYTVIILSKVFSVIWIFSTAVK